MPEATDPVGLGLQMLQERRKLLGQAEGITPRDRDRIAEQLEFSQQPLQQTRELLADHPQLVHALDELWPKVLAFLIKGNEVSPVHHIPYVVRFMTQIGLAEVSPAEMKQGVLAALLHDIGIGDCSLPKISEHSIQRATGEERVRLRRDGIASRLEHMKLGVEISRGLLADYRRQDPGYLSDEDIGVILDIVGSHDFSKIPLMEDHVDRKWLLKPGRDDWLKQCHWEADALWMLTPAGILVDLEREREENTAATRQAKLKFNLSLHRQIVSLYAQAYSPEEMKSFGFRDGLLYRSTTGYALASELTASLSQG
jgi:hypothetical protein